MVRKDSFDRLAVITFESAKANALESVIIQNIKEALDESNKDSGCGAILLGSTGENIFSAGADIREYQNGDESTIENYLFLLGSLLIDILFYPKPVLVKVQGKAIGGALGLLAASDYVVSSHGAAFRLPELELGIAPSVISPFLLHRVGSGFLKTLSFGGEFFDSAWAVRSGLVSEAVTGGQLEERTVQLSRKISSRIYNPVSEYKNSLAPSRSELENKIKEYSILNAKNIMAAKKRGLFAKKS
jgi:methylglutaconyl-CoA hydratase